MFSPRLSLASLSGESDAEWALRGLPYIGAAFLGGIAIDATTREAARSMVRDRERNEFLPPDPVSFIQSEFAALDGYPVRPAVNVRTTTRGPLRVVGEVCRDSGAILELNAHCRQEELCAVGCGESLLADTDRLTAFVEAAASTGATVGVKVRAEVPGVDVAETAEACYGAGARVMHVDAMDSEGVIREVREAFDGFVIANNGVRDAASTEEYLSYGADAVSVGRPSDNSEVLRRVRRAVDNWFTDVITQ